MLLVLFKCFFVVVVAAIVIGDVVAAAGVLLLLLLVVAAVEVGGGVYSFIYVLRRRGLSTWKCTNSKVQATCIHTETCIHYRVTTVSPNITVTNTAIDVISTVGAGHVQAAILTYPMSSYDSKPSIPSGWEWQ